MEHLRTPRIGTAGWAIPRSESHRFPGADPHLARYARILPCTEINATFYRQPRPGTLARWRESVPSTFRFAVKAPKAITHTARLAITPADLAAFYDSLQPLGPTLGPVLFQLPPSLAFDELLATAFFTDLRHLTDHPAVLEPRHPTWFTPAADTLLRHFRIARAAADPAKAPGADLPGGHPGLVYFRLHGSPRTYHSTYTPEYLASLAAKLLALPPATPPPATPPPDSPAPETPAPNRTSSRSHPVPTTAPQPPELWCIFDNTASGAAASNALTLQNLLTDSP